MKNTFKILFIVILLLGFIFESNLNADVIVHNRGPKSIQVGLLWTSVKSIHSGYINSYQWYLISPGSSFSFKIDTPIVDTECYWLALRDWENGIEEIRNMNGNVLYYTTDIMLPSSNKRIRLNDNDLAGVRGIGSTCFCGRWDRYIEKLSGAGYKLGI
jgi:hypothetical protein